MSDSPLLEKIKTSESIVYLARQDLDDFNQAINEAEELFNEMALEYIAEGMHPCIMIGILNRISYGLGFDIETE